VLSCHTGTNSPAGHQAYPAIDWPPRTRPRDFIRNLNVRPPPGSQDQARIREARACPAVEEGQQGPAQRDCAPSQTDTRPQAQGGWQVEGHRGGADQQRPAGDWKQVAGRKDDFACDLDLEVRKQHPFDLRCNATHCWPTGFCPRREWNPKV
jgi:hypothetical protein